VKKKSIKKKIELQKFKNSKIVKFVYISKVRCIDSFQISRSSNFSILFSIFPPPFSVFSHLFFSYTLFLIVAKSPPPKSQTYNLFFTSKTIFLKSSVSFLTCFTKLLSSIVPIVAFISSIFLKVT